MDQAARFNLFIVPFLQELKKELGYPIDIGKLKDIVGWAKTEDWEAREDIRLSRLYGVCKLMFLQDEAHELPFSRIFWQYIQDTLSWWKALEGVEAGHSKEVEKGPKADIAPISGGHETPDGGLGETPDLGDSWEQGAMGKNQPTKPPIASA